MKIRITETTLLTLIALALAGVAPNLFPLAQAGDAKLSTTGPWVLLPSAAALTLLFVIARARGHARLARRLAAGAAAGALATLGLEAVRITSFHLGGMPGDMPRLMGVLLTDRFMVGPSPWSDVLGWAYHFWNGAVFGIVFALVLGRRPAGWTLVYAQLIGLGFLAGPVPRSLGVGAFALGMPAMIVTVVLAHLAYGALLGLLLRRFLPAAPAR